ncbi:MAG: diaminopimelate epimerase, partial [Rhodothermia bacterium]
LVIDNRFFRFSESELSDIAGKYCPRRFGIGADGLVALDVPESSDLDCRMRYFNADGSAGEMCGNGARCLAAFAREGGILSQPIRIETDAGVYRAYVGDEDATKVKLILPASSHVVTDFARIDVDSGVQLDLAFMVSGVPHAVWFGNNLDDVPVGSWGAAVRYHACFDRTSGTNVDFVEIIESENEAVMKMRTYERGVEAETLACGTGAVSTLVAANESGRINKREAIVRMSGGDVRVGYVDGSDEMFLEGPVASTFRGTVVL